MTRVTGQHRSGGGRWRRVVVGGFAGVAVLGAATVALAASDGDRSAAAECLTPSVCGPDAGPAGTSVGSQGDVVRRLGEIGAAHPGFADLALTTDPSGVLLRWSGELPPALTAAVADADDAGVAVHLLRTDYGSAELLTLAGQVMAAAEADGVVLTSVGPSDDFSALEVTGPVVSVDADVQRRVADLVAQVDDEVPVVFAPDEGPVEPVTG